VWAQLNVKAFLTEAVFDSQIFWQNPVQFSSKLTQSLRNLIEKFEPVFHDDSRLDDERKKLLIDEMDRHVYILELINTKENLISEKMYLYVYSIC